MPRFYLRRFSADGRRIDLYNFDRSKAIFGAGIRGQCSKRNFYGSEPDVERALAAFEDDVSVALKGVVDTKCLPPPGSPEYERVVAFAVFQRLRTAASGRKNDIATDMLAKKMIEGHPSFEGVDLDSFEFVNECAVALPLSMMPSLVDTASDLGVSLFENQTRLPFVTSDDPVVLHNQYCESVNTRGVLGWNSRGLQVFWPLTPRLLIHLYDRDVYRVGRVGQSNKTLRISATGEVRMLNSLQILNAQENIYFDQQTLYEPIEKMVELRSRSRRKENVRTLESEIVTGPDGEDASILHHYERLLPIRFRLPLIRIRKQARRVPQAERGALNRKPILRTEAEQRMYYEGPMASYYPVRRVSDR